MAKTWQIAIQKQQKQGKQIYKNVTKSNTGTAIRNWRYGHSDNKQDDLAAPPGHTLTCFSISNTKVASRDTKTAKTWQIAVQEQRKRGKQMYQNATKSSTGTTIRNRWYDKQRYRNSYNMTNKIKNWLKHEKLQYMANCETKMFYSVVQIQLHMYSL